MKVKIHLHNSLFQVFIFLALYFLFTISAAASEENQTQYLFFEKNESYFNTRSSLQNSLLYTSLNNLYEKTSDDFINLLKWNRTSSSSESISKEKYNRAVHFGRWINDPNNETCYNTRAQVLMRDSKVSVSLKITNKCIVASGEWLDPYSDSTITEASGIDIDHMVPLKNAYEAGAWKWHFKSRCLYANYMGLKTHLISVSKHENRTKSDNSPAAYLPSSEKYVCKYIKDWLVVKSIWNLKMNEAEASGIAEAVEKYNCNKQDFFFSKKERFHQHEIIKENIDLCDHIKSYEIR